MFKIIYNSKILWLPTTRAETIFFLVKGKMYKFDKNADHYFKYFYTYLKTIPSSLCEPPAQSRYWINGLL